MAKNESLKKLQGTARKDRVRKLVPDNETVAWHTDVELSNDEDRAFNQIKDYLVEKKAWKAPFTDALAHYVRIMSLSAQAINGIKTADDLIQKFHNNTRNLSPEFSAYMKMLSTQMDLASVFGFTLKSHQNISAYTQQQLEFPENGPMRRTK